MIFTQWIKLPFLPSLSRFLHPVCDKSSLSWSSLWYRDIKFISNIIMIIIKYNAHPNTSSPPHNSLLSRFLRTNASPPLLRIKMEMLIWVLSRKMRIWMRIRINLSMTLKTKMSFRWSMSAQFTLISPGSLILGLVPKEEWKSTKKSSCKEKVLETQNQHRSCYPGNL